MRLRYSIFLLIFYATSLHFTIYGVTKDSAIVKTSQLEEVVVTGARNTISPRLLSKTVTVVDQQKIDEALQPSLLPTLTEEVPGLFATSRGVMGYGVSTGAAGSISLRGLSGGTGQMMVLIDGHPQYMGLMGHPIADAYQSFWAEQVEVLRGPASVLYGSNAMGGVVNIVTKQNKEDGVKTNVHAGYGSYNTLESTLVNQVRKGRFTSLVSGSYNRTDGHRDNMNFEQYGGYAKFGFDISQFWNLQADVNITHFNASQPGTVETTLTDADQSITRGMTSLAVQNQYERTSGAASLFFNWGHHWINDGYAANATPKEYRFNAHDQMMGISLYQTTRIYKGNRTTAGVDLFRFGGRAENKYVTGEKDGQIDPLIDKHLNEIAGYIDFNQDIQSWLTLNAGIRIDHHSETGSEWIPQGGLAFHLRHNIELKASASKGFRNPTLKEMYLFPPQNPDLKPERLWNYEVSFSQNLMKKRLKYGVNVFYIDGENIIVAVPRQGATPLNMNTGEIDNIGVEAEIAYAFRKHWSVDANYSYLHLKEPILSVPTHKLHIGAHYRHERFSVSTAFEYINGLYTATNPVQQEDFLLWNVRAKFDAKKWLGFWLKGENLLAQEYETVAGYPMPPTTVMAGVEFRF